MRSSSGSSLVECVLVIPLFFLFFLAFLDVGFMAFRQWGLERQGSQDIRGLIHSHWRTAEAMEEALKKSHVSRWGASVVYHVRIKTLPSQPRESPLLKKRDVQVITLDLTRAYRPSFSVLRALSSQNSWILRTHQRGVRVTGDDS